MFEKSSNTKFHQNPSSGSQVVPCGQTDRHDEAVALRDFVNAPKSALSLEGIWEQRAAEGDDMIYLLTAFALSPGGSTHLHTNNTQNNTNNKKCGRVRTVPGICEFDPGM
jgi:hypothetical protein